MVPQDDPGQHVKKANVYLCAKDLCPRRQMFLFPLAVRAISEGKGDFGKQN